MLKIGRGLQKKDKCIVIKLITPDYYKSPVKYGILVIKLIVLVMAYCNSFICLSQKDTTDNHKHSYLPHQKQQEKRKRRKEKTHKKEMGKRSTVAALKRKENKEDKVGFGSLGAKFG